MTVVAAPELAPAVATGGRFGALPRHLVRFAAVGVVNTVLFLAVYLLFRIVFAATAANLLASLLTTVTGTNANGRVTFRVDGPIGLRRHARSMMVTVIGMVITTGAVSMVGAGASASVELAVLLGASMVAGVVRFALLRHWVFEAAGRR